MSYLPFLLEIGTEEIPDWMIASALGQLRDSVQSLLDSNSLEGRVTWTQATPRRLALRADGIVDRQPDSEEVVTGPPKSAGAGAAAGFARKMGAAVDALRTVSTARGEYFSFTKKVEGKAARDILAAELPALILKIQWPKTMYWTGGKSGPRFIRPIRWLVALLGLDVVPFEIAGVKSGRETRGHRKLGRPSIPVTADNYEEELRANGVILSAAERRAKIESEAGALVAAAGRGLKVRHDPDLLETLVHITEYPTPILGRFDEQYLDLPGEVLVTVMKHHQKYFSVEDGDGKLAPNFIAVMNTSADPEGLVRHGNERVLRARFNDARFFWEVDQHRKLADRVADLAHVTFQAKLGSYLEKAERMRRLARELATLAGTDPGPVERAVMLSKTDLTTEMVKEFTELQGVVGGLYAKAQGEPEEVWRAVYDHYKPQSMEDSIPATLAGKLVSLADKLDTLRGCFGIGLIPKGSGDPFALRRAAQGVVRILVEGRLGFPLSKLIGDDEPLRAFLLDRVRYYFREVRGFRYDEVNAVLASASDDLPDVAARLTALQQVRPTENFEPLAASFKRIQNILRQANFAERGAPDEALLESGPERQLYDEFRRARETASRSAYLPALEAIASLRPAVDLFFDKVLVNAPDEKVRRNRLMLLNSILTEFSTIADFSEIVTQ
jgi:glycyl-tRNA synthetase beta chain